VGDARETIQALVEKGEKFDLVFIDADKGSECSFIHNFNDSIRGEEWTKQ